jgi:urease accessory protein
MMQMREKSFHANQGLAVKTALILCSIFVGMSSGAWAHSEVGVQGGLLTGFLHPISGLDHLIAMVAVGLWGAQLGRPLLWILPVAFPMVMAFGGALGIRGVPIPAVEVGIAVSGLLLGLFIAMARKVPMWAAITLVGVFAIFHGHAHGTELPSAADPIAYAAGFVSGTGLLHLAGIAVGTLHGREPFGPVIVRVSGGIISAMGAWFLYSALSAERGGEEHLP